MAALTQSGDFFYLKVVDYFGTVQDLTQYIKDTTNPFSKAAIDLTTPGAGGTRSTRNQQAAQVISTPQVTFYFDPALVAPILYPLLGKADGSLWSWYQGNNAAPQQGDVIFKGTFTLFTIHDTGTPGNAGLVTVDLRPSDQGAVTPGWYPF